MTSLRILCVSLLTAFLYSCAGVYEVPPDIEDSFGGIPLNGGRTQAISVDPNDRNTIIIATQFGGMWKTTDGGNRWRHVRGLQTVFVKDVQFAPDGRTVVATLARDIQTNNGGGIYISRDAGGSWARPPTGIVPTDARTPERGSAFGIDFDPDNTETWYVGTDFGIARSSDNGASWEHFKVDNSDTIKRGKDQDRAFAVLALKGGVVLAMLDKGVYRSDNRGADWTEIRNEYFGFYGSVGFNKMDRERGGRSAFILKDYSTLYYYEPDSDTWTSLDLPDGGASRSPFVRVSKAPAVSFPFIGELEILPGWSTIWVGQGVRAVAALTVGPTTTKALTPDSWVVHGRSDGIHDDTGDLGVAGNLRPIMMGTDGGVFKPTSSSVNSWSSGAPDGSRLNSLLITDLAGTNTTGDDGRLKTTLYFSTQDNALWSSDDNGRTWPRSDCAEGFHIEVRKTATTSTPITVGYGKVGCGPSNNMYSDAHLFNQRAVPDVDTDGDDLDKMSQAFYLAPDRWIRTRGADTGRNPGVYVSSNDGDEWRRRFDLGVSPRGVYHRSNVHFAASNISAYLPVDYGQSNADGSPRLGLIRLNNLFANQVDSFGTADVIELPNLGSLARRATEFDWQVVYGVHPKNAEFIIAPDIVNQVVKMTRDGGSTWTTNWSLTSAAKQAGKFLLWDKSESRVQIMHISYDPYNDNKILVGTRDAGVICSIDGGVSWRTIRGTEPIRYITGFQFREDGSVLASAYGRGLWRIKSKRASCDEGIEWLIELPDFPDRMVPWEDFRTGQVVLQVPDEGSDSQPTGRDLPGVPVLSGQGSPLSAEELILDANNVLIVRGRGFDGASDAPLIIYINGEQSKNRKLIRPDPDGSFNMKIELPEDIPYGEHRLDIHQQGVDKQYKASIWFRKIHLDEHLGEEEAASQSGHKFTWEDATRQLYETMKELEGQKN